MANLVLCLSRSLRPDGSLALATMNSQPHGESCNRVPFAWQTSTDSSSNMRAHVTAAPCPAAPTSIAVQLRTSAGRSTALKLKTATCDVIRRRRDFPQARQEVNTQVSKGAKVILVGQSCDITMIFVEISRHFFRVPGT